MTPEELVGEYADVGDGDLLHSEIQRIIEEAK